MNKKKRSTSKCIFHYSLMIEYRQALGRKRAADLLLNNARIKHIWNPHDSRSVGPLGDSHLVQRKLKQSVPPNQKKKKISLCCYNNSWWYFPLIAAPASQMLSDLEKEMCFKSSLTDLNLKHSLANKRSSELSS